MKRAALKLTALLAFACLAAVIACAQPAVGVQQYTVSCPTSGTAIQGMDWVQWWANIQPPSYNAQASLVLFDAGNYNTPWTVLDSAALPVPNIRQIAPFPTLSGHNYQIQIFVSAGPLPKSWGWYNFPPNVTNWGGAGLSCS
jgi:hypothetical protein